MAADGSILSDFMPVLFIKFLILVDVKLDLNSSYTGRGKIPYVKLSGSIYSNSGCFFNRFNLTIFLGNFVESSITLFFKGFKSSPPIS